MCLPCGPRSYRKSYYEPHPLPTFNTLEAYLAFLKRNPANSESFRPLPMNLQNTENYVAIVKMYPEMYEKVPKKYQNKQVKAAAGIV